MAQNRVPRHSEPGAGKVKIGIVRLEQHHVGLALILCPDPHTLSKFKDAVIEWWAIARCAPFEKFKTRMKKSKQG